MHRQRISVQSLSADDIPQIIELMLAQNKRQDALDPRLHLTRARAELQKMLKAQLSMKDGKPLVVHNAEGDVRGYAFPLMWEMEPDEEMVAFFSTRNGSCQYWTLPAPTEADALPVTEVLLDALAEYWQKQQTHHDVMRWPSSDLWLEPALFARGFLADNIMALRSLEPLPPSKHPASPEYHARLARREDEEAIVRLHHEEMVFHLSFTPFVRLIPALEIALRERLALIWEGKSVQDGAPLVMVIEHNREVVAMAENELLVVSHRGGGFGLTSPGRYGYLNNVCVSEKTREQGVGRLLVEEVLKAFLQFQIDAYVLWYSKDNPRANGFWPHMGFRSVWKTYQRINSDDGVLASS